MVYDEDKSREEETTSLIEKYEKEYESLDEIDGCSFKTIVAMMRARLRMLYEYYDETNTEANEIEVNDIADIADPDACN